MTPNIILASGSPRRRQILTQAGLKFEIDKALGEEKLDNLIFSKEKIEKIAYSKADEVSKRHVDDIIISADTVVVFDGKIFTKPKDRDDAFKMLKTLSGKTHFVQTSICIIYKSDVLIESVRTDVTFNTLSDEMIYSYIDEFKPFDKAGAYGIQELPQGFINNVLGDIENVIGISSAQTLSMLKKLNIS